MRNQLCRLLAASALVMIFSATGNSQSVKTRISYPFGTLGVATNPVSNKVYVVAPQFNGTSENLTVIDGNQDTVLSNISVPAGSQFAAVNYLINRVYVTGCNYYQTPSPCTVTAIDGKTNTAIGSVTVTSTPGLGIAGIAADPISGNVYVANASDNVINVVNGYKMTLADSLSLNNNSPAAIAFNPLLKRLYVPLGTNQTLVVDACSHQIIGTTNFGSITAGAAVDPLSGHAFVTDANVPSQTAVLDRNGNILATIAVPPSPLGLDVDPATNEVFVSSTGLDQVAVIDGSTNTLKTTVSGVPSSYIAVNFASSKVYVSGRTGVTVLTE